MTQSCSLALAKLDRLEILLVSLNPLYSKGAAAIFRTLTHNFWLETVAMSSCHIGNDAIDEFALIIPTLPRLKRLFLQFNELHDAGITTAVTNKRMMQALDVSNNVVS